MGECILVTSGKGGVGKSSITLNLGASLAKKGYKVVFIDMDLGLHNLDVLMGLENRVIYDIKDVMEKRCSLNQALIKDKKIDHLYLLPACKNIRIHEFEQSYLTSIVSFLSKEFDYIFLDSPAGIERGFNFSLSCADRIILVTTLDYACLNDVDRVIGLLYREGKQCVQLVVNRVNPRLVEKGISVSLKEALSFLSIDLLGIVYEDEVMIASNNKGNTSLPEYSILYDCFETLSNRLLGKRSELPKFKGKTLIQRLFG